MDYILAIKADGSAKGNRALTIGICSGVRLNSASDHSVTQDWILDLTEEGNLLLELGDG